jgi:hypothetical protein
VPLFALSWVFDHVFDEGDANLMWQITLLLSLVAFSSAFFLYLRNRALLRLDGIIANRIQPAIWHRLFELQVTIFRKISKSELISKISNFDEIREDLSGLTSQIFISSLFSSLYFIAMLIISPLYTGIVLPFLALDIWLFVHFMRHKSKLKNHLEGARGKRDAFLDQALSGLKKIRSEGLERKIFALWQKQFLEEEALENKLQNSRIRLELLNQYMPIVLFGIIMILFMAFPPSLGSLVAFYLALFNLSLAIREITQISFDFSKLLNKIKKVEKIMEEPLEKDQGKEVNLKGEVIFQEVAFSQISSLTFHIKQGEKVGIVGEAAATIVRLILGQNVEVAALGLKAKPSGSLLVIDEPRGVTRGVGEIEMSEGTFKAYGQDLTIERGRLIFNGPIDNPGLDVRAYRKADDGTIAGIEAKGTAQKPQVTLWSTPSMTQSEALAYLLLGHPLNQAQPQEGNLLANAATSLGIKGGNMLAKKLAARFGLEEARIEGGKTLSDASLVVGKYLSPKLYVAYGMGLFEPVSTFSIRYLLSKKITLQAERGTGVSADALYTVERK